MEKTIAVQGKLIGKGHQPFIIAEMSGNHHQSLEHALAIVDAAAKAGADALKLQTYTPDTMTIDCDKPEFYISHQESLWRGSSLYQLYQQAHTPWAWHEPIFKRCKEHGMIGFSTPFDLTAVDFLEKLDVPLYKISSFENTDLPLIKRVAETGKPIILSTGMASIAELAETVECIKQAGCNQLILLKCTSSYPASPTDSHLMTIPHLADLFDCLVGLSDHTLGIGVAIASIALGASVIEKHFTVSRALASVDAAFSLEPAEMQLLTSEAKKAQQALGMIHYGPTEDEVASLAYRRSLYVVADMKKGDIFTPHNIKAIRPGFGLPPKFLSQIMGKAIHCDAEKGTPVSWRLL